MSRELIDRKVTRRDIEGFLSAFVYNKYGATSIDKIAPFVFEKDANTLSLKLASVTRPNPPPEFVNENLGLTQPIKIDGDNNNAKRIRDLLVDIETASFVAKPSTYSLFKEFDVDGDGFVSYKDFERHLKAMKINATPEEIQTIMKNVLDINQNGFVDYAEFSKRFGPTMSRKIHVQENHSGLAFNQPGREKFVEFSKQCNSVKNTIDQVRASFLPDPDASKFS